MTEDVKKGFFQRLREGLTKTRKGLMGALDLVLARGKVDAALLDEVEALLITADFGVATAQNLLEEAMEQLKRSQRDDGQALRVALADTVRRRLASRQTPFTLSPDRPHVILVVGINGVGKTTTIGKLAAQFSRENKKVLLAAGDTFRAAAVEQLKIWGERAGVPVVAQDSGSDSASVIFDAYAAAKARGCHLLLADTAGRLHTKSNLMDELKKVKRVLQRQHPRAPHDVWLVLDATTGQNAVNQARQFHHDMGLTGLIVTKLDGTAKGGVVVGIGEELGLPIRYLGVGEGVDDLRPFDPDQFVEAMFGA